MKIDIGFTGATSYTKRFESPAQKIGVVATAVAEADLVGAFITVQLFGRDGVPKIVTPRTPLVDLMEIAASNEGMVLVENATAKYKYTGTIELSNSGAIDIAAGGYMQIQIDNAVSTTSWDLYAIDGDVLTDEHISYMPVYVNASQYKELNLQGVYAIAVPKGTIVELQLSKYGRTQIWYPDELKMNGLETNEISFAYNFDTAKQNYTEIIPVGKNWYVIGVRGAVSGRVMLSASGTVYAMSNEKL